MRGRVRRASAPARRVILWLSLLAVVLSGCEVDDGWVDTRTPDPELEDLARKLEARAESLAVRDTIESVAWLQGVQPTRVLGYGIVVGLGENGSRECPPDVRKNLIQEVRKRHHLAMKTQGIKELDPRELLSDLDTAVVVVTGNIPGAAMRGSPIDVRVSAAAGTQTKSIEGGYLWRCELKRFRAAGPAAVIQGKTLAYAEGPVFVNPFDEEGELLDEVNQREGMIPGGGVLRSDRNIRLEVREPSYQVAIRVARKINERFGQRDQVADAVGPGTVELSVPLEYRGREQQYLDLVLHTFLSDGNDFLEQRTRDLAEEILNIDAPHHDIALAWEAIGRSTLPVVRKLYTHRRASVNYYSARAGLRMDDEGTLVVMRRHANDVHSPFQEEAIEELGHAVNLVEASGILRRLLSHDNDRVRILAYKALRARRDRFVLPQRIGEPNFVLDRVRSSGSPLIYARTRGSQCLAVFGDQARCRPPIFYEHPDDLFSVSAGPGDESLSVLRRSPDGRLSAAPVQVALEVGELATAMGGERITAEDREPQGLNLAYSYVVRALYQMCSSGGITARFLVETPDDELGGGPLEEPGRPETDLED